MPDRAPVATHNETGKMMLCHVFRPCKLIMWSSWIIFFLVNLETQAFSITVNLTNGPGSYAGRVEVKYNGSWGQVCDYGINMNFGHVICRQLGYPQAIATPCYNAFGKGNTHYWMTNVRCKGNESSLAECDYTWGKAGCSMGLKGTVGVVCERPNMTVTYPPPLRLAHTTVPYAGCVQVKYAGIWGQIGMFGWDLEDGRVACRQLGYRDVLTVLYKWNRTSQMLTWMDIVKCTGNEQSLSNCSYELVTYRSAEWTSAGVVCKNNSKTGLQIHLRKWSVSYAGRIEVFLAGKWGAINSYNWQLADAHVACRQLGFSGADLAIHGAAYVFAPKFSGNSMDIQWLDNVECRGSESSLDECPHEVSFVRVGVLEAGVVCKTKSAVSKIRLAGSSMTYAGRIEVNIAGVWGTIRNRGWNITSAHVACKELGYPGAETAILFATETFGQGEGPVWMSNLNCQGHESTLWECSWSRIAGIYWDHYNDAGVICRVEDPSSYASKPDSNASRALEIGLPVTAAVLLLLGFAAVFYFRYYRRWRGDRNEHSRDFVTMNDVSSETGQSNPAFERTDSSYQVKLDSDNNDTSADWCEISRNRLTIGEKIGSESDGGTFRGKLSHENGNIASCIVKTATDSKGFGSSANENDLLTELKILSCLGSHPNILNLFGACTLKGPTYLVFEETEHGSLLEYLKKNRMGDEMNSTRNFCTLSKVEKLRIALDVSKGMRHIAERNYIHKGLAARNVRLGKNCIAKVANIGFFSAGCDKTFYEDIAKGNLSEARWMAPESLETKDFTSESDVWSFGVLLWEIETGGDVPYPGVQTKDLLESLKSGHRMDKPVKTSTVVYELMTKCWRFSAIDRPKFSELCMVLDTLVTRETYD
ncbi:unnamed protein product [Pocillopora meandrina]|uniref:Uncharacterized protein n=1 Tax=Pocillopora meandrina TaxID=46732 RepID=A0AAU9Y3A6_9CNID|nr:unnamed protein product [Pocillopora meandrina]